MKARDAVGRTIVAVKQSRHYDGQLGRVVVALDSIELDDGTVLLPTSHDDAIDTYVTLHALKRGHRG